MRQPGGNASPTQQEDARTRAVGLHFRLQPDRRVDLDNLIRPALAGLRDAGVFTRGFPGLHGLLATKVASSQPGRSST